MPTPDYDPKEVAALQPDQLDAAVAAGRAAFSGATDLEALAAAHTAHLGNSAGRTCKSTGSDPSPPIRGHTM